WWLVPMIAYSSYCFFLIGEGFSPFSQLLRVRRSVQGSIPSSLSAKKGMGSSDHARSTRDGDQVGWRSKGYGRSEG
ncbi:hypothetical protein AMTR_s00034p00027160, partial [Amborella trichopoda]